MFYDDTIGFAEPNLSAQVAQMKQKGVDFVVTCMDINEVIVLAKEMQKQGLKAVQQLPNGYDQELIANNADLLEGSIVIPQFVAFEQEPQIPEVKNYLEQMKKIGKDPVEVATTGWILADQFVTGPRARRTRVLAAEGHRRPEHADRLQRQRVHRADRLDEAAQRPATDPSARGTEECANFTQVKAGKFVVVWNEPGKPWACFPEGAANVGQADVQDLRARGFELTRSVQLEPQTPGAQRVGRDPERRLPGDELRRASTRCSPSGSC